MIPTARWGLAAALLGVLVALPGSGPTLAGTEDAMGPLHQPKVNQLGYLPDAEKYFCSAAEAAPAGSAFPVVDTDDVEVLSGVLPDAAIDDMAVSGEHVHRVGISGLRTPGTYRVKVGDATSWPFVIGTSAYDALCRDTLRALYVTRANASIDDPVTGVSHPAAHTQDADIGSRDVAGGWYNAGDYGKWTHEAASSVASMFWLYELPLSSPRASVWPAVPPSAARSPNLPATFWAASR